jgi:hypothetical protein
MKVLEALGHYYELNDVRVTAEIIRAAVEAERERCAAIADTHAKSEAAHAWMPYSDAALSIARDIRGEE